MVVLISGYGSNLQAIIDQIETGYINANIQCVISNRPDAYGLKRAKQHTIVHHALDHTLFESREAYDAELIKLIQAYQPDYIILAGFMRILTAAFFQQFNHKIINIHPSLLPKYQGLHCHQRALENKDPQHGVSVHIATEELDSGQVIAQASFNVNKRDSLDDLEKKCHRLEHILYPLVLRWLSNEQLKISTGKVIFNAIVQTKPLMLEQISLDELPQKI